MRIDVLDKGYVRLVPKGVLGDDLTIVNAARVSFDKESEELSKSDLRILDFLAREGHTSPFRHGTMQFEVYAPLMIARQWWKYVVGSDHTMDAWNESSRRYITEDPEFYIPEPDAWRSIPENKKQGSGDPIPFELGFDFTTNLVQYVEQGEKMYEEAIENGICVEQARLFLPAYGMYVRWRWTGSVQSVAHLISQRVEKDSQWEFQQYAKAINEIALTKFPNALGALRKYS
jgi:thymidylate synthase (FAD)